MIRYATVIPDGMDIVRSVVPGYYFIVPDVAAVDAEIRAHRRMFLDPSANIKEFRRVQALRDQDHLLERRWWLQMRDEEAA